MRASNPLEERLIALTEPAAAELGYRIVRLRMTGLRRRRLQIMAERAEDGAMGLEDCVALSRSLSPLLEASDPLSGDYDLEVSSPGIDRPLVRLEDFERFAGHDAKLETIGMVEGRRRFRGVLAGVIGQNVRITIGADELDVPFSQLADARLVLTDRLIAEDLHRARAAGREPPPEIDEEAPPQAAKKTKRTRP